MLSVLISAFCNQSGYYRLCLRLWWISHAHNSVLHVVTRGWTLLTHKLFDLSTQKTPRDSSSGKQTDSSNLAVIKKRLAVRRATLEKLPGVDGIFPTLLQKSFIVAYLRLLKISVHLLHWDIYHWRVVKVVYLCKVW